MTKTRVPKGEIYYWINSVFEVCSSKENDGYLTDIFFRHDNYFRTKEEAESMTSKLRAVLKGADVIEMPSEEELRKNLPYQQFTRWSDGELGERNGWRYCYIWLKSKIVK